MTNTTLIDVKTLLPKIVPHVSGCNDELAKLTLIDAARTFARESDIVIETQVFQIENAPGEYALPENSSVPEKFLPLHFINRTVDNVAKTVSVTYSLLPIAEFMPKDVIDRHYEAVIEQAMFCLFNTPGKPWTSGDLATFHLQKYRIALGDAMRDNNTSGAVFHQQAAIGVNTDIFLG